MGMMRVFKRKLTYEHALMTNRFLNVEVVRDFFYESELRIVLKYFDFFIYLIWTQASSQSDVDPGMDVKNIVATLKC